MKIKQLSVFLENRFGQLAEITHTLAQNHIDLRAISIAETADYGVLRLIADDAERAATVLLEGGHILTMTQVTVVGVPDEPAGLAKLLSLLAEAQIDIEYMYSLFAHPNGKAYMVFRVSNDEAFGTFLAANGIEQATRDELGLK